MKERAKQFGKEMVFSGGKVYMGLLLVSMTPLGWPTLFGILCVHHGVERGKKALAF